MTSQEFYVGAWAASWPGVTPTASPSTSSATSWSATWWTARRTPAELDLYPRHFGVTFRRAATSTRCTTCASQRKIELFADVSIRFEGLVEAHRTFVLRDPSDNLIEFKHYTDPRMMY